MFDDALQSLLKRLSSRKERVREEAKREAQALLPEQWLQLARLEAERYRRRKRFGIGAAIITGCLILALIIGMHRFNYGIAQMFRLIWPAFLLFLPRRGRRSVADILQQTEDIRLLGPALEMATQTAADNDVKKMARDTVKSLLPHIDADHVPTLTAEHRRMLVALLDSPLEDSELTLRILKALEQVGGAEAIPAVEQLTDLHSNRIHLQMNMADVLRGKPDDEVRQIREAAEACLPLLRANAERLEQSQTLLRASSATTVTPPEVLLRPAMPVGETTAPEELLRPSAPDSTPPEPVVSYTIESATEAPVQVMVSLKNSE